MLGLASTQQLNSDSKAQSLLAARCASCKVEVGCYLLQRPSSMTGCSRTPGVASSWPGVVPRAVGTETWPRVCFLVPYRPLAPLFSVDVGSSFEAVFVELLADIAHSCTTQRILAARREQPDLATGHSTQAQQTNNTNKTNAPSSSDNSFISCIFTVLNE